MTPLQISIVILYAMTTLIGLYAFTSNYAKRFAQDWYTWTFTGLMITITLTAQLNPRSFMFTKEYPNHNPEPIIQRYIDKRTIAHQHGKLTPYDLQRPPHNYHNKQTYYRNKLLIALTCLIALILNNKQSKQTIKQALPNPQNNA